MRFDGFWSRVEDLEPEDREYALMEARAALEAAAPLIAAQALEDAAQELARLPYASPFSPDRAEYERILAVRRGDADKWLLARAATVRGGE